VELLLERKQNGLSMQMAQTMRNPVPGFYHRALDNNTISEQTTGKDWKVVGIAHLTTVSTSALHD
jgi:hypothetical protein